MVLGCLVFWVSGRVLGCLCERPHLSVFFPCNFLIYGVVFLLGLCLPVYFVLVRHIII